MDTGITLKLTVDLLDELVPLWQELTKTEDTKALIARDAVNALLDLRSYATEYEKLELATA